MSSRICWPVAVTSAGLVFAVWATAVSWEALADRRTFDLVLRGVAVAGVAIGGLLLRRRGRPELGALVLAAAVAFFVQDLRASHSPVVFVFGFWFAYLWTAFAAHVLLSWPAGKLERPVGTVVAVVSYVLAVGSQAGRYFADAPRPGWLYDHPPNTRWAHIGSICAAVMALAVIVVVLRRWRRAPTRHRPSEPVWLTFVVVAVAGAAAAVASVAGVPDGQIEVVPAAIALVMGVPAGWVYLRIRGQLAEVTASRRRIATIAAEERQRIMADLHDGAQQALAAVQLRIGSAVNLLAAHPGDGRALPLVRRAHDDLGDAITALRDLVQQIYPSVLREYGLYAALEEQADRSPVPMILHVDPVRWNAELEVTAYFAITEAVANSIRHAAAGTIAVTVSDEPGELCAVVRDDGRGEALPLDRGGLRSLQDRVAAAGGTVDLSSVPSHGTVVTVHLPKE